MSPGDLEIALAGLVSQQDKRVLTGLQNAEDAAILHFPAGQAMVQTLDFFTPIVNDPYKFGQIAAANSLSDVYAMGGTPYSVMNIVCFPASSMDIAILREVLRGGHDKILESGAVLVGGHSVQDQELKYGLSVTGIVDPDQFATNAGLRAGDQLILTKPVGSGILATAIKAEWDGFELYEEELFRWASRLNNVSGAAIQNFKLQAATDVTGFGLGGHLLEMSRASNCTIVLGLHSIPVMEHAFSLASVGLIPAGSYANRHFCEQSVEIQDGCDSILLDLAFDAQTSGGLVLAVPGHLAQDVCMWLADAGEMATLIGQVEPARSDGKRLVLCP